MVIVGFGLLVLAAGEAGITHTRGHRSWVRAIAWTVPGLLVLSVVALLAIAPDAG